MSAKQKIKNNKRKHAEKTHEEIITTHINADFDALASMIAASKLYPEATLVFPGSQEKNLRNFFLDSTSYLFNFAKIKQIDFDRIKRLILVDTRQKVGSANLLRWSADKVLKSTSMTIILIPKTISVAMWRSSAKPDQPPQYLPA